MMNKYVIQLYLNEHCEWADVVGYPSIMAAVAEYQFLISDQPESTFRLIEIHEVEE